MPHLPPAADAQQLADTPQAYYRDIPERLQSLERQMTLAAQRQRNHVDAELQTVREHVLTLAREMQQQQQALLTSMRETIDELRQEVAAALQHLSQDVERVAQHGEGYTNRMIERTRHELLATLPQRTSSGEARQLLGDLLVRLGRQLQDTERGDHA